MREATIYLGTRYGAKSHYSEVIGAELRSRRLAAGLSQRELARPLSGSYISSVEKGRVMPSLAALLMMLDRLGVSASMYFEAVNGRLHRV